MLLSLFYCLNRVARGTELGDEAEDLTIFVIHARAIAARIDFDV